MDSLHCFLIAHHIDIALICETWLSDNTTSDAELSGNGRFQVFRRDRDTRGGGVLILVKSGLTCSSISTYHHAYPELVGVELLVGGSRVRCLCAYFSPTGATSTLYENMSRLCSSIEDLCAEDICTYVTGDFNLPAIDWTTMSCPGKLTDSKETLFLELCCRLGLSQLVHCPTRPQSQNILDLVLCNDNCTLDLRVSNAPFESDHLPVMFGIRVPSAFDGVPPPPPPSFAYRQADTEVLKLNLSLTNWQLFFSTCSNVNDMFERLAEYLGVSVPSTYRRPLTESGELINISCDLSEKSMWPLTKPSLLNLKASCCKQRNAIVCSWNTV